MTCDEAMVAQQWTIESNGEIQGSGGLCLNVQDGSKDEGANVFAWPCDSTPATNEQWRVQGSAQNSTLATQSDGKCLGSVPTDHGWTTVASGGSIGHKRIVDLRPLAPRAPRPSEEPTFLAHKNRFSQESQHNAQAQSLHPKGMPSSTKGGAYTELRFKITESSTQTTAAPTIHNMQIY